MQKWQQFVGYKRIKTEHILKEFLKDLYIKDNLCVTHISALYKISKITLNREIKYYGLIKTKEQIKESIKNWYLYRYGVDNPRKSEEIKDKIRKTNLEKYGTEYGFQSRTIKDKIKNTVQEKYGVENISQLQETKDKIKNNCLKKYSVDNVSKIPEIKNKVKQTNLKKYGAKTYAESIGGKKQLKEYFQKKYDVDSPFELEEIKNKKKDTNIEKYGCISPFGNKLIRQKIENTNTKRYGVKYPLQLSTIREKIKKTNIEKYGYEVPSQSIEIQKKMKKTCMERYGVDSFTKSDQCDFDKIQRKIYETKKKNGTFCTSSEEEYIYKSLKQKYSEVLRQYRSKEYPFSCDFYIPSIHLYIEYQGHVSHGKHPFNPNDPNDIELLEQWKTKAQETNFNSRLKRAYTVYINTWTVRDPLKRQIVRNNNLNWIEFFNLKQFNEWYKK